MAPSAGFRCYKQMLLLLFCLAVFPPLQAELIYVVNSESRTLSRIDTGTDQVQNSFCQLGLTPNKMIVDGDWLWSVNSGDNAIQKISRQSGASLANILIESGCNPWDACLADGFLYVTGLFTNKVYKIDPAQNSVAGSVQVGTAPEALCAWGGKLYVTNTGGWQNNYANSSVSVIDLDTFSVSATIPVSANPQYIVEHAGLLHVSCTGNWTSVVGAVCVIDPENDEVIHTVALGGSLGGIWIGGDGIALAGDAAGTNLYRYDASDFSILNGVSNPLPHGGLVVQGTDALVAVLDPNWGGSGMVRLLHPDLSFWKEYTVGLAPTDLKLYFDGTALHDEVQSQRSGVTVYPNPARLNGKITFRAPDEKAGIIGIYNLKGQLVSTFQLAQGKAETASADLVSGSGGGCYLYRIETGKTVSTGKFILLP